MPNLAQQYLLLSLDRRRGVFYPQTARGMEHIIAAAVLLELLIAGKVGQRDGGYGLLELSATWDNVLDRVMRSMCWWEGAAREGIGPALPLETWLDLFAIHMPNLIDDVLSESHQQGTLTTNYGERISDAQPVRWRANPEEYKRLRERVRFDVLQVEDPGRWSAVLAGLLMVSELLTELFSWRDVRRAEQRCIRLVARDPILTTVVNKLIDVRPPPTVLIRSGR